MITLEAPYPSIAATVTLPNPTLGDSIQHNLKTKFGFAMSGRIVTTVSTQPERKIQYNFNTLKRSHVDALITFMKTYAGSVMRLTDYNGVTWRVQCLSNPIEFSEDKHFYSCQLDFQGTQL
jgi:hypothetical protein